MKRPGSSADDRAIEQIIAVLLRTGVLMAAAIVLIGGVLYLHTNYSVVPHYQIFTPDTPFRNLRNIFHSAQLRNSQAIIQVGIVLLIATPVARVLFSVVAFALERDQMYVAFSFTVLVILLFSIFHGASL